MSILNPSASVTIGLSGLAVLCPNKTFNNNRGRWEVAIPRFNDHSLRVEITGIGTFNVERDVKFIDIRDRGSIPTELEHIGISNLDRTDLNKDTNDLRWVTDFSNELPHKIVSVNPGEVDITMLYIYDAIAYTRSIDSSMLIRPDLEATARIDDDGKPEIKAEEVIPILESTKDFVFEARLVGMDIESSGGDVVDIIFDRSKTLTLPQGREPQQILISNQETSKESFTTRFVETEEFHFGLGDFYRYFDLFETTGQKLHQWGKQPKGGGFGPTLDCCCNLSRVSLSNLSQFVRS